MTTRELTENTLSRPLRSFLPKIAERPSAAPAGEPWGPRLWFALAVVMLIGACIDAYGIRSWPMADDEVPTLVELGLTHVDPAAFSVPAAQIGALPRTLPVWYAFQRFAIGLFPNDPFGFRLPSLICAVLAIGFVFAVAARSRGLWFAGALALIVNGSLPFVYLSQINRFYSMPLLMLILTLAAMQAPSRSVIMTIGTAVLALLAVLSHNVIIVVFVLSFLAAIPAFWFGRVSSHVLIRSALAAAISVTAYFLYVRPLVSGWASTGNPTPVLVSFASQAGVPTLALAFLGGWLSLTRSNDEPSMLWWALIFAGSLAFLQVTAKNMSWNPRYFLFLMPAIWMLGAYATEFIARQVRYGSIGLTWYAVVIVLLMPNLLSHYQDGSRHDYRQAAAVLSANAQPDQPILSDDAETISYYLPDTLRQHLYVRTKVTEYPVSQFFLVCRANAWAPLPRIPRRRMDLVAEIYRRRFDEFSHILRVYRVAPAESE